MKTSVSELDKSEMRKNKKNVISYITNDFTPKEVEKQEIFGIC
jgi:hypothetical protein